MVNEPIKIVNADPVLHNIKAVPTVNRGFNISQPTKGMETERAFSQPESAMPLECNVHGWMHAGCSCCRTRISRCRARTDLYHYRPAGGDLHARGLAPETRYPDGHLDGTRDGRGAGGVQLRRLRGRTGARPWPDRVPVVA